MSSPKGRSDLQEDTQVERERGKVYITKEGEREVLGRPPGVGLRKKNSWFFWQQDYPEKKPFVWRSVFVCWWFYHGTAPRPPSSLQNVLLTLPWSAITFGNNGVFLALHGNSESVWTDNVENKWIHERITNKWILPVILPFPILVWHLPFSHHASPQQLSHAER